MSKHWSGVSDAPAAVGAGAGFGQPPQGDSRSRGPLPTYAALDLGTNNCRLLIARPSAASKDQ